MINIRARIEIIERLLAMDTVEGATYAALECRSTIEAICYERFTIANSHLALADLKKWQPRDVVRQVIEEANAEAGCQLVLSIATKPKQTLNVGSVRLEDLEYVEVGRQSELRYKVLGKLHNALSNVALHVQIPTRRESVKVYGDKCAIEEKVREALAELEAAASGTLLMGATGSDCTVECVCGSTIKRKAALLREGQVVCCNNPDCSESYTVSLRDSEAWFTRRTHTIPCNGCGADLDLPERTILRLRPGQYLIAECGKCKAQTCFKWSLSMSAEPIINSGKQQDGATP